MEVLIRFINQSTNPSIKGFIRWIEILSYKSRGISEFERALAPAYSPSLLREEAEDETPDKLAGFLWAAPKKRTSIMKRIRRKFGHEDWGSSCKLLKPKTNLRICDTCGHHYEAFHLCSNCYERIKQETLLIRKQAEIQFGHDPVDKNIVVLYESEKDSFNKGIGKANTVLDENIIVEIPKPRPNWFSGNLLQRSTLRVNPDARAIAPQGPIPTISDGTIKD